MTEQEVSPRDGPTGQWRGGLAGMWGRLLAAHADARGPVRPLSTPGDFLRPELLLLARSTWVFATMHVIDVKLGERMKLAQVSRPLGVNECQWACEQSGGKRDST